MKYTLLVATALLLNACGQETLSPKNATEDTASVPANPRDSAVAMIPADTASIMIAELERLQRALEAGDKNALAGFYDFPISENAFSLNVDPSDRLRSTMTSSGGELPQIDFLRLFEEVKENQQYPLLLKILKKLKLRELGEKAELNAEEHQKGEACYTFYSIGRRGADCSITYGTNSDPNYHGPENDEGGGCAEYAYVWQLVLRNGVLKFVGLGMAG